MDVFDEAIQFAVNAHKGQKRKASGLPAIFHSIEAAEIVSELTDDPCVRAAAVLHDTVEDAGVSIEQIRERFGERVAFLVAAESENKREGTDAADSWMARKEEAIELLRKTQDPGVRQIFLGDKLSNMRSFEQLRKTEGDMWRFFHQKDPEKHHWYYRTIAELLKPDLGHSRAWREYDQLIDSVFGTERGKERPI